MRKAYINRLKNIYWKKESTIEILSIQEMNEKEAFYTENGIKAKSKMVRLEWMIENTYNIDIKGYWKSLYCRENGFYKIYRCHTFDDTKNLELKANKKTKTQGIGSKAISVENQLFKDLNGITPRKAFGYCDRELIGYCIPKQLYYINNKYLNKEVNHVSLVDFCSQFPANMKGKLPDWNTKKEFKGTVKPTEEYPFAFYINSRHCAEYKVFDTHNWLNHELNTSLFGAYIQSVKPEDDITILCKASKYEYTSTIDKLFEYKQKKELINGVAAKDVLNSAIGFKHLKNKNSKRCRLDHLAAIAIARANQNILNLYDKYNKVAPILMIVVDSLIYKSAAQIGIPETSATLGSLKQECTDCQFKMIGTNQYMLMKNNKCVKYAHSGYNSNIKTEKFEDMNNWSRI